MGAADLTLFKYWPDAILVLDGNGLVLAVSKQLCEALGVDMDGVLGGCAHDLFCAPARSFLHDRASCPLQCVDGAGVNAEHQAEGQLLLVDGAGEYHQWGFVRRSMPLPGSDVTVALVRLLDDALFQHTLYELKRMTDFVNASCQPFIEFSALGDIQFCNPMMNELILQYDYSEKGTINILPPNIDDILQKVSANNEVCNEVEIEPEHGVFWSWNFYPCLSDDASGAEHIAYVHAIGTNVTLRKAREQSEQHMRELMAQAKEDTRKEELAKVIHDFRSPLNSIVGYANLLRRQLKGRLGARENTYITYIQNGGQDLAEHITRRLQALREELTDKTLKVWTFDTQNFLHEIGGQLMPLAEKKALQLNVDAEPATITSDRDKLRQILVNFGDNAIKYTEVGNVDIRGFCRGGDYVFAVYDSGRGLDDEEQARVFSAFERVSDTAHIDGFGLGLSVVKELAEQLGGELELSSELGRGSCFAIVLPQSTGH